VLPIIDHMSSWYVVRMVPLLHPSPSPALERA